ncbi:2,3,4,5-tetrahydropyridine-2,6-dicarboxylate N-succinyltransferase [Zobellella denitrificans]|uniref:2,3,4,5-tetrahydropyridine-2,6-dicarboxylate N-succinyltransferase n=1 Tax=Zobellella denitrificans TaxID=347534 RepID=A0A231MVQ3_9GAMM|nr:2,3,4,5-tetrahydropyridine-2,6-dicarboxylate N-succinyltransferase [Zobellella denitrificans]ATG73249.1 2,3,4,5-tetrahydropyridine-2,6-carboxylate N-succinyltransferase [Zobellella denitrificans]OXS14099.1 2,3,4,5-tetrahydropyridine-2,6-dicarboxylate N-succinyltransferase [Zobellella denitrificans]
MANFAFGLGVGTKSAKGEWLEVYYNQPLLNADDALIGAVAAKIGYQGGNAAIEIDAAQLKDLEAAFLSVDAKAQAEVVEVLAGTRQPLVVTILETDAAPASTAEVYLKLALLSHRLVKPHGLDLSGMFGLLPNVAWTSEGAIAVDELARRQLAARAQGRTLSVNSVDKFPKMTDYVVPAGVRIGDASRIRLGAHVGEGTTVMHEGFINFNAGTLGVSMVEGRISAGVVVGNGSDLGGGCSTMGTLSGGGNIVISVGEGCLLGANAGLGIPLGDRCTIESGLYITAGSKVTVLDDKNNEVQTVKAADLAGKNDLLFRRNSQNGRIEVKTNKSAIELNAELHKHN